MDNSSGMDGRETKQQIGDEQLSQLIEASLFVMAKAVSVTMLKQRVLAPFAVSPARIRKVLSQLQQDYHGRGIELIKVAGGYRFQTIATMSPFLQPLWTQKAVKYSRATLETLAVIAYRQPVTRGDIELVRGVTVSSHTIKQLTSRNWIEVVGHKEVAGRPGLYATTKDFLAYFGLDSLADLPPLTDAKSLAALFNGIEQPQDDVGSGEDASVTANTEIAAANSNAKLNIEVSQ